jgi:hypothetical protein
MWKQGNSVVCEVGPFPVMTTTISRFPLTTCITPNRAMGLVLIGLFSTPVEVFSYWPFTDPVGVHPHWSLASLSGVRQLQSRMFRHYCGAEARNTKGAAFKLNHEHNPQSDGNGEGERKSQLTLGLHGYLGVRVQQRTEKI